MNVYKNPTCFIRWSVSEWGVDKVYKDFSKYFYLFDFSNAIEKNNSLKYIKELCDNHDVYIATASHIDKFNQKYLWLLKHAPFIKEDNIMLIKDKSLLRGDIIVDDAPHNFGGDFKYKFMYNSNHNINCDLKGVKRIDTLKEVVDFVCQIERNHILDIINETKKYYYTRENGDFVLMYHEYAGWYFRKRKEWEDKFSFLCSEQSMKDYVKFLNENCLDSGYLYEISMSEFDKIIFYVK